jgi:hypothetical protein
VAAQPLMGQGFVVIEDLRSHSDTSHSVDFLWTTYQPDLTTLNTQNRHKSMSLMWFEPAFPTSERPQTHVLDHTATRMKLTYNCALKFFLGKCQIILLYFWVYTKIFDIAQNLNYFRITYATCELLGCQKKLLKL